MNRIAYKDPKKRTANPVAKQQDKTQFTPDPAILSQVKEEAIRWLFTLLFSVCAYWCIASVIVASYHPDVAAIKKAADEMFFDVGIVHPEPVEALLFKVAVVSLFPLLAGFYALLVRFPRLVRTFAGASHTAIVVLISVALLALVRFSFTAGNPFCPATGSWIRQENNRDFCVTNFDFYFKGLFLENRMWLYTLFILPLVSLLFFYGFQRKKWHLERWFKIALAVVGYPIVVYTLFAIVVMHSFTFPHTAENKFDFNAVYYSMTQVYAGVPLLVDNYMDTYGLYPHFLLPVFRLIGLSIFKFSFVMALLLAVAFLLNYFFLRQFVRSKLLLLLGISSIIFFPFLNFKLLTIFDSVFSLYPIRYIVPSLVTFLAGRYLMRPSPRLYYFTFVLSSVLVLWNPEIGLVCFISWTIVVCFKDFWGSDGKVQVKTLARHMLVAVAALIAAFVFHKVGIRLVYGSWPDMSLMFATASYFGVYGVGCLPMTLLHPWNLSAIVLLLGFIYAISSWVRKRVTTRSAIILLVSMIGVGYFTYYQGRSHNSNFALSSAFSWVLLVLLADDVWSQLCRTRNNMFYAAFLFCLFLLSFSWVELWADVKMTTALMYQDQDRQRSQVEQNQVEAEAEFVNSNSQEGEKIFLFTVKKYQCLLFDGYKRVSAFNPGLMETFLRSDLHRMERMVVDSSHKFFVARNMRLYDYFQHLAATIASNYEVVKVSPMLGLLAKSKTEIPANTYFSGRPGSLVHRKYARDSAGIARRVADADSIWFIRPDTSFSVEALFFSSRQCMETPTLIGNVVDSFGFSVGKMFQGENVYYCAVNNRAVLFQVPFEKWVYLVANYTPTFVEVYVNGTLVARHPSPSVSRPVCKGPVRVGALKNYNYFVGAISEVAVSNSLRSSDDVLDTWATISRSLP